MAYTTSGHVDMMYVPYSPHIIIGISRNIHPIILDDAIVFENENSGRFYGFIYS